VELGVEQKMKAVEIMIKPWNLLFCIT